MQQLTQDIQNHTFKKIYLLYGEEAYLRIQYKNKLKAALVPEGDDMNYSYFEGKDVSVEEIIDLAETMPFMSEYRVIFLENTGMCKDGNDKFATYIEDVPDTTVIVMTEMSVDKRTKLFKAIGKAGRCVEFAEQNDATLKKWIAGRMKNEGFKVTEHTLDVLLETVGTDMLSISMELEKLFSYCHGRDVIAIEDVNAICSVRLTNRIFDMIGMIGLRKQTEALNMYQDLLFMKESPFGILALINRQFGLMLQIADLKNNGVPKAGIASRVGLSPYIVGKYMPQIDCFTISEIRQVLEGCAKVDQDIKAGNIKPELGVELLIIESSMPRKRGSR